MKLNIGSYNIWHGQNYALYRAKSETEIRPDNLADVLYRNDIAICGLNEVDWNCKRSDYLNEPYMIAKELTARTGVKHYWAFAAGLDGYHGKGAQYGNALVSRYPIVSTRELHVSVHEIDPANPRTQAAKGNFERRALLIAELDVEGKPLTVITTHFGLQPTEQVKMMDTVESLVKEITTPIIFMGDFNITYKTEAIYPRIAAIFKDTSADPALPLTFPSTGANRKIDFIFTDKNIVTENPRVEQVMHSDHLPLFVTMEW